MDQRFVAAVVQLTSTADVAHNLRRTEQLVRDAAGAGATFIATPENTPFLGPPARRLDVAEPIDGPVVSRLAALADELGVTLLLGSFAERCDATHTYNTSVLLPHRAAYRKVHCFDVDIPGGPSFRESEHTTPGHDVVVADGVGLSICFDLRFPELYTRLVEQGARLIGVPSAFTIPTGRAHWHTLLRARAIETQCYVLAPAQDGVHGAGRESFGHSLIVGPWGEILAEAPPGEGFVTATIDLAGVDEVRRAIPLTRRLR